MRIKRAALDFILGVSKKTYPREFTALLRGGPEIIEEVVLLPGSLFGEGFASLRFDMKPNDPLIIGSVHSHPGRSSRPSDADLVFFGKAGFVHLIAGYPYGSIDDITAYDLQGCVIPLSAVD